MTLFSSGSPASNLNDRHFRLVAWEVLRPDRAKQRHRTDHFRFRPKNYAKMFSDDGCCTSGTTSTCRSESRLFRRRIMPSRDKAAVAYFVSIFLLCATIFSLLTWSSILGGENGEQQSLGRLFLFARADAGVIEQHVQLVPPRRGEGDKHFSGQAAGTSTAPPDQEVDPAESTRQASVDGFSPPFVDGGEEELLRRTLPTTTTSALPPQESSEEVAQQALEGRPETETCLLAGEGGVSSTTSENPQQICYLHDPMLHKDSNSRKDTIAETPDLMQIRFFEQEKFSEEVELSSENEEVLEKFIAHRAGSGGPAANEEDTTRTGTTTAALTSAGPRPKSPGATRTTTSGTSFSTEPEMLKPESPHVENKANWSTVVGYDFLLRDVDRCDWEKIDVSSPDFDPARLDWSNKPYMFTNYRLNHALKAKTQKHRMLREFGDKQVILSNAVTYSHDKKYMSFAEYLKTFERLPSLDHELQKNASTTWYLCGDNFWPELLDEYVRPSWLPNSEHGALAFGIGRTGSGIPLHRHGGALLEVTNGRKRWFVAPTSSEVKRKGIPAAHARAAAAAHSTTEVSASTSSKIEDVELLIKTPTTSSTQDGTNLLSVGIENIVGARSVQESTGDSTEQVDLLEHVSPAPSRTSPSTAAAAAHRKELARTGRRGGARRHGGSTESDLFDVAMNSGDLAGGVVASATKQDQEDLQLQDHKINSMKAAKTTSTKQDNLNPQGHRHVEKKPLFTSSAANSKPVDPPFDPEKSSFNWFYDQEDKDSATIQMCTQNEDEALWLPDDWWHSTLNIGETVFWLLFT
ncbi:unnamed protein product [Amoebophrya sp. A120]|nr:unnamed protein product [Amoebophrya sp. A120]|eukprot:GSA120T00006796001.1